MQKLDPCDTMEPLVIIKFGGGLITFKDKLCEANYEAIRGLSEAVQTLMQQNIRVIIVHGAGGFGHIKAKKWKLHLGFQADLEGQFEAVEAVRNDMKSLSTIVVQNLEKLGLKCHIFQPSACQFIGTGSQLNCDLKDIFSSVKNSTIPILHGDVVPVNDSTKFGILSGDDICVKTVAEASKLNYKTSMVFAMTDAPGVLTLPPTDPKAELVKLTINIFS